MHFKGGRGLHLQPDKEINKEEAAGCQRLASPACPNARTMLFSRPSGELLHLSDEDADLSIGVFASNLTQSMHPLRLFDEDQSLLPGSVGLEK